ncbi:MAG TPA: DeoR family transcriptional regulator [Candidatus Paceibacterota bacterium]|nr:DeoR family transcriptional regulator [Candidatus Paceibacterota bacterium]
MFQSGKKDLILKKSYEIAYALWRVAENVPERTLADRLSGKAIELLGCAADGNYEEVMAKAPGIEFLVRFGNDVGGIGAANRDILLDEIGNLRSAISAFHAEAFGGKILGKDLDLSDIFSKSGGYREPMDEPAEVEVETQVEVDDAAAGSEPEPEPEPRSASAPEAAPYEPANMRQSAILERMRQTGNCRLGDIQAILPNVSERTIRYDLEALVERNLVERIGTGGRGVFYRIRQSDGPAR